MTCRGAEHKRDGEKNGGPHLHARLMHGGSDLSDGGLKMPQVVLGNYRNLSVRTKPQAADMLTG
jgi:hypothetical protein